MVVSETDAGRGSDSIIAEQCSYSIETLLACGIKLNSILDSQASTSVSVGNSKDSSSIASYANGNIVSSSIQEQILIEYELSPANVHVQIPNSENITIDAQAQSSISSYSELITQEANQISETILNINRTAYPENEIEQQAINALVAPIKSGKVSNHIISK
ncbi:MAG: hypothetical protein EZS28_043794 [Streblomastix strix]|uniref:Uncharacterized protein n=1 Tax=Streblomastix strix TaxID=222440 RepID=A0A5J4TRU1_9EUKA|nr:MAG: hypothetical protein EZS28_043794 [Streblomastix strix]